MVKKVVTILILAFIVFNVGFAFGGVADARPSVAGSLSVERYSVNYNDEGSRFFISSNGLRMFPSVSSWAPVKIVFYAIPPGYKVEGVNVNEIKKEHFSLEALPDNDVSFEVGSRLQPLHSTNSPAVFWETGKMRKWNFIKLYYTPFKWQNGNVYVYKEISFNVALSKSYKESDVELNDTVMDFVAKKVFVNYNEAKNWYQKPLIYTGNSKFNYLIIVPNSLKNAVNEFVSYKETEGYSVKVITLKELKEDMKASSVKPDTIRNFLKKHYLEWGTKYVLFVGSQKLLPMCYMYPEPNEKRDESGVKRPVGRTPTDFYYAELDSNWDADKDQLPGEYSEDTNEVKDYYPDVFVGRIPFDSANDVKDTLSHSIKFEEAEESFRKSALLAGAMLYYGEEGTSRQDGALALNFASDNYLKKSGFDVFSMYEKEGTHPSPFESSAPLTRKNFLEQLSSKKYGLVLWNAHGSPTSIARKYWVDNNHDKKVSNGEIKWKTLLSINDLSNLSLAPSIFYSASCETAWPEKSNLAKEALLKGASAFIGASRISYGGGTIDPVLEGFVKHYAVDNFGIGDSLDISLFEMPHTAEADFVNLYDFNLYGDPSIRVNPPKFSGFNMQLGQRAVAIEKNNSFHSTVHINIYNGEKVNLSYSTDIYGVTIKFDKDEITESGDVGYTVYTTKDVDEGSYTITISGENSDSYLQSLPLHIEVIPHQYEPYDVNKDGIINGVDLLIFARSYGSKYGEPSFNKSCDFNNDKIIDDKDLSLLSSHFGEND